MKILVTGFDPFGNETVNPAFEAVKFLPDSIAGAEIMKLEIPTSFKRSEQAVEAAIQQYTPDVVINVGQAGGASCVRLEQVAVNLAQARIPDNDGYQPAGEKLKKMEKLLIFPHCRYTKHRKGFAKTNYRVIFRCRQVLMCAIQSCIMCSI